MKYYSTRGNKTPYSASQAIKKGLADDGGLFMPETIPQLSHEIINDLCKADYAHRAAYILSLFLDDYSYDELLEDCLKAYGENRFPGGAAPLVKLDDVVSSLELWHGPTSAFKDMALQIMPCLLSRALEKTGEERTAFILVATSGDTGKAALEGYRDVKGVKISVFYPVDGVSRIQKLQMATQEGANVYVNAVRGNFDDAQNGVKRIFSDSAAGDKMNGAGYFLSSANSINWGRLAPQIAYYVSAYCDLVTRGDIKLGDEINVCVPTGNFGNIFAAYIAREMGVPVARFVCASNTNNILSDFLSTGKYDRNRKFYTTMSPSMDILISSNLERLIYFISGCDDRATSGFMSSLSSKGSYTITEEMKKGLSDFMAGYATEEETASEIRRVYDDTGYIIDTHTGVASAVYRALSDDAGSCPAVIASTASPYKFARSIVEAVSPDITADDRSDMDMIDELEKLTDIPEPKAVSDIKKAEIRHNMHIPADRMKEAVRGFLL